MFFVCGGVSSRCNLGSLWVVFCLTLSKLLRDLAIAVRGFITLPGGAERVVLGQPSGRGDVASYAFWFFSSQVAL